jgi:4-amino-4-deoxy-L-arabinose transferase-like glycosyltransferase
MKKNIIPIGILLAIMITFFLFGFYNLSKFETSDEYLWKHTRISQYWEALKKKDWEKTYIDNKPGVSMVLISGLGLLLEPHPETHHIKDRSLSGNNIYATYEVSRTEKINFSLRLPILFFNTLFLIYFFWIIKKLLLSRWLALMAVALIAFSPPLIGISQIINPDALLWSLASASFLTFLALIKEHQRKLVFLCGVLCGFSLLSKYTANILFPSFLMIVILNYIFNNKSIVEKNEGTKKYWLGNLLNLLIIFLIACLIYSIFFPVVFKDPSVLYLGTIGFSGFRMIILPFMFFVILIVLDIKRNNSRIIERVAKFLEEKKSLILRLVSFLMLCIFLTIIANVLTGQKMIPIDEIQDSVYSKGKLGYEKVFKKYSLVEEILVGFYPFVFSLTPIVLILVGSLWMWVLKKGKTKYELYLVSISIFTFIYFLASALSKVLTNVRYSIILYPLFSLLAVVGFSQLVNLLFKNNFKKFLLALIIIFLALISVWHSRPYYLSYVNSLLPQKFNITDSWGYGSYEAAQFLNSLPEAEKLIIWTNRKGVCQFFKGKCIRSQRINLSKTNPPDYFVISRRGMLKNNFSWTIPSLAKNSPDYYYSKVENDFVWKLEISDRPSNFVAIVKSEE